MLNFFFFFWLYRYMLPHGGLWYDLYYPGRYSGFYPQYPCQAGVYPPWKGDKWILTISFKLGVAKPLPEGKKVPAKAFSCALWHFLKIKFVKIVLRILQQLIEKLTIKGAKIVWSNYSSLQIKLALFCILQQLILPAKLFLTYICARQAF